MEILNLKNITDINFKNIIESKHACDIIINDANNIIKAIKDQYIELLKNISNVSSYLGIDSFNFQNKLLDMQLDHLKKLYNIIIITKYFLGHYFCKFLHYVKLIYYLQFL